MNEKIKVIVKEPGKRFEVREVKNTLGQLQELVGGHIEAVTIGTDAAVLCNEEGRILALPEQRALGCMWAGTILVAGVDGEEFTDVPQCVIDHPDIFNLEG